MSTTLELQDDSVVPGESWFLYWKTASSLWPSKLKEFSTGASIIVPINWSFHSETGEVYDFAKTRPETNLKRLVDLATELGKRVIFFLPIAPAPFLPNGGLPHLLARSMSLNYEKMAYGVVDPKGRIHKIYSFFDPRVFQAFQIFVTKLGEYFASEKILSDIWTINCGYFQDGRYHSYLEDRSRVFESSFRRFLESKKSEQNDLSGEQSVSTDDGLVIDSIAKERELIEQFTKIIKDLYSKAAQESLEGNWRGELATSFIGGSCDDFIERIVDCGSREKYSKALFYSICSDIIPSSILLSVNDKKGVLKTQFKELVNDSFLPVKLRDDFYEEDGVGFFTPLYFFELVTADLDVALGWDKIGLGHFIYKNYRWGHKVKLMDSFLEEEFSVSTEKIYLFEGRMVDTKGYHIILKMFMQGAKIVLNHSGLSDDIWRKMESFFLENSLEIQKVNLLTKVSNVVLGEGRIVFFEDSNIKQASEDKKTSFWRKLFTTFELLHLEVPQVDGIDYFWKTRFANSNELNYEEVRRLSLYNRTSYKKKVKLSVLKNFALMKVVNKSNASIRSATQDLEVELLPDGVVAIDFGVFF